MATVGRLTIYLLIPHNISHTKYLPCITFWPPEIIIFKCKIYTRLHQICIHKPNAYMLCMRYLFVRLIAIIVRAYINCLVVAGNTWSTPSSLFTYKSSGLYCTNDSLLEYESNSCITVYPKKYAHGFVVLCFVVVMQSFIMNSHEVFIHIHQGCFAGTGAIVRLPQCQWSKPDGYWKISQCITTTKRSKAKTVCIFLGIYCTWQCSSRTITCKCLKSVYCVQKDALIHINEYELLHSLSNVVFHVLFNSYS